MRLQPSKMLTAPASSVCYGSWIHGNFGHVVSMSQAYLRLLRAGYAALIGAILSFSRTFWLTVFGFRYSSMVLDSCVKVRCLVLCIGKCLGRRCRSVIDIAVPFWLLHICSLEETLSFCLNPTIIQLKNYFVLSETLNLLMTYFPGSEYSGNSIEL